MDNKKNIIVGTAGHIDHGKTTLIRALTGRNTDRLKEEQYLLGRKAGKILKAIHSLKVEDKNFEDKLKIKLLDKIEKYESSDVRVENDDNFIEYVKRNVDKVCGNYSYLHGDFHPSNLILMKNNEIGVIDFNRWEISNSYEEFYKLESFGIEFSIPKFIRNIIFKI